MEINDKNGTLTHSQDKLKMEAKSFFKYQTDNTHATTWETQHIPSPLISSTLALLGAMGFLSL